MAAVALDYVDHRADPAGWARSLGVSRAAIDLYLASDVIDLHVDAFIWTRVAGYDLLARHGSGLFAGRFYSHTDLPRLREACVGGAIWSITTNPLRASADRPRVFADNLARLRAIFERAPADVTLVRNAAEYRAARAAGKHAAFVGIQGGNALDRDDDAIELCGDLVVQVTLVHLSTSSLGNTSSPLSPAKLWAGLPRKGRGEGLSAQGIEYVRRLDARRIFVDLAHVDRRGFFDAVAHHDRSLPLIVTHTGVSGAHRHWRNVDDEQLRAVADSGGTLGVIYQSSFLGNPLWNGGNCARIVDHRAHICDVVGEDHASLGSDWDGMIITPRDMPTCLELPRLVQVMLDRGWSDGRIGKILGGNFLRALETLRG
ncbi:MAG: membrane dipeptidase [Polyangiales bacterium]